MRQKAGDGGAADHHMDAHILIAVCQYRDGRAFEPVHLLITVGAPRKEQEITFLIAEEFSHFFHAGDDSGSEGDPVDGSGEGIVQIFRISVHLKTCI